MIHDPATGVTISDSFKIARYLDKTYPSHVNLTLGGLYSNLGDSLTIVPEGTAALQMVFEQMWAEKVLKNLFPMLVTYIFDLGATARARDLFRKTREEGFGKKLEDMCPAEARPEAWKKVLEGLKQVGVWLDMEGHGDFVMGEKLSWGDVVIGNWLLFIRRLWGGDNSEWKELMGFDEGRWKQYFDFFVRFEYVDEEGVATLGKWIE